MLMDIRVNHNSRIKLKVTVFLKGLSTYIYLYVYKTETKVENRTMLKGINYQLTLHHS